MAQTSRKSCLSMNQGNGGLDKSFYKEVRFSPTPSSLRRTQSLTVARKRPNHPTSADDIHVISDESTFDISDYIEQSKTALESQRLSFERERAAFAEERRLWDKERAILKRRIVDLEQRLVNKRHGEAYTIQTIQQPDIIIDDMVKDHHVWEGSSPNTKPSRIFSDAKDRTAPISEEGNRLGSPPSLDEALSPRSRPVDRSVAVGVPVEMVDSRLDGITLKSTALPPDIVAKVSSPPLMSSTSPPQNQVLGAEGGGKHISKLELNNPDDNLKRDAGHTPKAIIDSDPATDNELDSLEEEVPLAPQQTLQRVDPAIEPQYLHLDDDPALTGPLNLQNDKHKDMPFLQELDKKLLGEAKRIVSGTSASDGEEDTEANNEPLGDPEIDPEIKFRKSTNFGTAFGSSWDNP